MAGPQSPKLCSRYGRDAEAGCLHLVVAGQAEAVAAQRGDRGLRRGPGARRAAEGASPAKATIYVVHPRQGAQIDIQRFGDQRDGRQAIQVLGQGIQPAGFGVQRQRRGIAQHHLHARQVADQAEAGGDVGNQVPLSRAVLLQDVIRQHFLDVDPRHEGPSATGRRRQPVDDLQLVLQIMDVRFGEFGAARDLILVGRVEQREGRGTSRSGEFQSGRQTDDRQASGARP